MILKVIKRTSDILHPAFRTLSLSSSSSASSVSDKVDKLTYICHVGKLIKLKPWQMAHVAKSLRGLSVEDARGQLAFASNNRGSQYCWKVLEEAVDLARQKGLIEKRDEVQDYEAVDLWVAESFVTQGDVTTTFKRHRRWLRNVQHFHTNFYLRLDKGTPPDNYRLWKNTRLQPQASLEWYVKEHLNK